ncbi:MAG: TonB-dependent receptor [Bacteroidota bacterium]
MDILHVVSAHPWRRFAAGVLFVIIALGCFSQPGFSSVRIHGTIVSDRTGAPVAGATIRVTPGEHVTLSGPDGRFAIAVEDSGTLHLHIRRIGFEPFECETHPGDSSSSHLRISLVEAVYSVDPVVSTAIRGPGSADDVPFSIEAVSAADLRMKAANDLGELLNTVPGILMQGYGALGDVQTLSIRGSTASQVLILLDGQRMNSAQSGEIDLSTLPLESVRRVEIVRGGASAQYGADAMGGVVNIITGGLESSAGSRVEVGTTAGSFGTRGAHADASLGLSGVRASISYRFLQSDNSFLYAGPGGSEVVRQNADYTSHVLTGRMETRLNEEGGRLVLNGEYLHQESGDPGSIAFPLLLARKLSRNITGTLALEQPFGAHVASLQVYLHALRFGYTDPNSYIPTANDNHNTAGGLEIGDMYTPSDRLSLSFGYSYRTDRYTGNALDGSHTRVSHGAYVQSDIRPLGTGATSSLALSMIPAIRWDRFSDFGTSVSPKFGIAASIGSLLRGTVKGNVGTSFRAPTFNDLYWPFDGYTVGNPSLSPERSTDVDAGIVLAYSEYPRVHTSLTYYHNNVRDLILWQPGSGGVWAPSNIGRASIHGWETEIWFGPLFDALRLGWTMTTIEAVNTTEDPGVNGKRLPYRPAALHKVALRFTRGSFEVTLDVLALGRRFIDAGNTSSLPPVHTMNAAFGYQWRLGPGTLDLVCAFKNIEDVRYELIDGYPLPGREVRLTLGYGAGLGE